MRLADQVVELGDETAVSFRFGDPAAFLGVGGECCRVSWLEGDLDTVRSATSEGVRASREAGDLYSLDQLLLNLGLVALKNGDLDEAKPLRHAMHVDVSVAREHAEGRLAAALAAGGRVVVDNAPSNWILADRAGNRVCIAAWPDGSGAP